MKHIKLYEEYTKLYNGQYVLGYFESLGSENQSIDENPIFTDYKEQILNNEYLLIDVEMSQLLENDVDLKHYVENEIDDINKTRLVDTYGLIGNTDYSKDVVIDGFHRITQNIYNRNTKMKMLVPIWSKFNV